MDWTMFAATNILLAIKQFIKNPKSKAKYKSVLMGVANAINALYANDPVEASAHVDAAMTEMHG